MPPADQALGQPDLGLVDHKSLAELTYESLRSAILRGAFRPGERLTERDLSQKLGVSTTPVKEALRRLELEGLVRSVPRSGTFVSEDIKETIEEMGVIRAALEGAIAYLAASKATDDDLAALREQLSRMEQATRSRDISDAIQANQSFHELIHQISKNRYLQQMSEIIRFYDRASRQKALSDQAEMERGLEEHRKVYEAIAARAPDAAQQAMVQHIMRTTRHLKSGG